MSTSQLIFGKALPVGKQLKKTKTNGHPLQEVLFTNGVIVFISEMPATYRGYQMPRFTWL